MNGSVISSLSLALFTSFTTMTLFLFVCWIIDSALIAIIRPLMDKHALASFIGLVLMMIWAVLSAALAVSCVFNADSNNGKNEDKPWWNE